MNTRANPTVTKPTLEGNQWWMDTLYMWHIYYFVCHWPTEPNCTNFTKTTCDVTHTSCYKSLGWILLGSFKNKRVWQESRSNRSKIYRTQDTQWVSNFFRTFLTFFFPYSFAARGMGKSHNDRCREAAFSKRSTRFHKWKICVTLRDLHSFIQLHNNIQLPHQF